MIASQRLGERETIMLLWAKGRLGERETVEWVTAALKQICGSLGAGTETMLAFLAKHAEESEDLSPSGKKVWRLLHTAAKEGVGQADTFRVIHNVKQKIEERALTSELVDQLIDCYRPCLRAQPLSEWAKAQDQEPENDPLRWVHWDFDTSLQSSYQPSVRTLRKTVRRSFGRSTRAGSRACDLCSS